jgi:endonuclease/exonuclease/phosphatase family metal-dependent hydrolase
MAQSLEVGAPRATRRNMTLRLATYNCENLFSRASRPAGRAPGARPRRHPLDPRRSEAKARVLRAVDADVQCLLEVEDRSALEAFNGQLLRGRFPYHLLLEGNDRQAMHLGVLSKLPLGRLRTHCFDRDAHGPLFGRDCLELELELPGGRPLHLLLNHFDAAGDDAGLRRQAQAVGHILLGHYDLARDLVAVLGDLNDSPQRPSQSLAPLLRMPGLNDVLALQFPIPDDRWTGHRRRNEQLDYILVSDALKGCFVRAGAERRGMPDLARHSIAGERPFPRIASSGQPASARAAVWADFEL